MLTAEKLREILSYDPERGTFVRLSSPAKWRVGQAAGSIRPSGRMAININGKLHSAHRLAWLYVFGKWPTLHVDHINGNPLDNRLSNLREATVSQNIANSKLNRANKTGLKGVSFDKRKCLYRACIMKGGKQRFLGYFKGALDAHAAYLVAAKEMFGEFARAS